MARWRLDGLFKGLFAAAVFSCTTATEPPPSPEATIRVGAEVLLESAPPWLREQRIALLTNRSARIGDRPLASRLASSANLVRLFAPEHGFSLDKEAGAAVSTEDIDAEALSDGEVGSLHALEVRSWYGADAAQRQQDLADIDVLLVDLPDVGARYFTYVGTTRLAMEAAAVTGTKVVVLDRPNPLGGELVSGWIVEEEQRSLVAAIPVPIVHGMTIGELALMMVGEGWSGGSEVLDLEVSPVENWRRQQRQSETGLAWYAPSPNLPIFQAALVYAGTCLFEATTLNEGRGTEDSFLLFGAPWLDAERVVREVSPRLPGLRLQARRYTPVAMPGRAERPRYEGEEISGVAIEVLAPQEVRPLEAGIELLSAVLRQAKERDLEVLDRRWLARLSGSEELAAMLDRGAAPAEIVASWQQDVERFRALREPYLLYD